jgi:hypothetical protein
LVFGGVLALALVGIAGLTLLRPGETPPPEAERPTAMPAAETSSENAQAEPTTEYRVVDLPEKTRRQIFNDYQRMMASSFGKAKKIPEGGAAGQALRGMLQATVDREITQMALIHGVSEQDIRQIIAEGKTKGW